MIPNRIRCQFLAVMLGGCLFILFPFSLAAGQITVFAPASLSNAMERIRSGFEDQTEHTIVLSLAGSSALARQIEYGAPADVFISANPEWMNHLEAKGRIITDTRFDLAGNRLVLIAHGRHPEVTLSPDLDLSGMLGGGRLAMALTQAVPAGIYGKAALTSLGLWNSVAGQVAQADNVRAALALVATGEAPFGVVYGTDARVSREVSIVATFPEDSHPAIVYPAAAVTPGRNEAAPEFLDYLKTSAAQSVLAEEGFSKIMDSFQ